MKKIRCFFGLHDFELKFDKREMGLGLEKPSEDSIRMFMHSTKFSCKHCGKIEYYSSFIEYIEPPYKEVPCQ